MIAVLIKVGTEDASGVVLRPQVVHLPDLAAVLAPGDGGGITGGRLGGFRRVGGKGGGGHGHGKGQDAQQPSRVVDGFPLHRKITSMLLILGAKKPVALHGVKRCPVFDGSCAGALLSKGFYRLKKGWAGLSFQQVQQVWRGRV